MGHYLILAAFYLDNKGKSDGLMYLVAANFLLAAFGNFFAGRML